MMWSEVIFTQLQTIDYSFIVSFMRKDKKEGLNRHPTYLAIFALDGKQAHKMVRSICKQVLLEILKQQNPKGYLQEEQKNEANKVIQQWDAKAREQQIFLVEKDYQNFQNFNSPQDNYHCTCLYIGKSVEKLNKQQRGIYQNWKDGIKLPLQTDFIVYVPGYIMAAYISNTKGIQVHNQFPHITLLIKGKAKAVESNDVLETLHKNHAKIFQKRNKRITCLHSPYGTVSRIMYVIDQRIELDAVTGNDLTNGRK